MFADKLVDFFGRRPTKRRVVEPTMVVISPSPKRSIEQESHCVASPTQVEAYGEFVDVAEEDSFPRGWEDVMPSCLTSSSSSARSCRAWSRKRRLSSSSLWSPDSSWSSSPASTTGSSCSSISGLPLVCSNCGVSFFTLQSVVDEEDCYCSGECKWSVILYREMDDRMRQLHRRQQMRNAASCCSTTSGREDEEFEDEDDEEDEGSCLYRV